MPIVREYQADANPSGPIQTRQARTADTGDVGNAITNAGGAVSQLGQELHKRDAQAEISDLTQQISEAHADFSNGLDQAFNGADPEDRTVADKFMQSYDDRMDEIGDNISTPEGQAYFAKANAQMRSHFQVASFKNQSALVGENAVQNWQSSTDNLSSSLLNDPSAFQNAIDLNETALDALSDSHGVPSNKVDELRSTAETNFAKSAVRGWINLDPAGAKQQLEEGKWNDYLNGDQKYQLTKEAEQGIHGQRIEAERQQKVATDAFTLQQNATQNQFLAKLQNNQLSAKDVLNSNLDAFGSGSKKQFLDMIDQNNSPETAKTDPGTFNSLFARIHLPDGDPKKLTDENVLNGYLGKGLTLPGIQQLRGEMEGKKTEQGNIDAMLKANFLTSMKDRLTKTNSLIGQKDPEGDERYQAFLSQFLTAYDTQRKGGKDASTLLNPLSPDYMGKMVLPYERTATAILRSQMGSLNTVRQPGISGSPQAPVAPGQQGAPAASAPPITAPPKPKAEPKRAGESPADYLKRAKDG